MLSMECQEQKVSIDLSDERLSMLTWGKSRMGKTFFASLYVNYLLRMGNIAHLIDLGDKWSISDKQRSGIPKTVKGNEIFYFRDTKSLLESAKYFSNALGYRSTEITRTIRNVMKKLLERNNDRFSFKELLEELEALSDSSKSASTVYESLSVFGEPPNILVCVDELQAEKMADTSTIWDLVCMPSDYAKILAQMILCSLLEVQRARFRNDVTAHKIFVVIDEFQNLDMDRRSILGVCLAESKKYKLYPILITQFIGKTFSETTIRQLMQAGLKVCFRLEGDEARYASRLFAYNETERKMLEKKIQQLGRGECFFIGPHRVGTNVSEKLRLLKIEDVDNSKNIVILNQKK